MSDRELFQKRYEIVTTKTYKELRRLYQDVITELSGSAIDEKLLKGMLLLLRESDSWEAKYISAVDKYKRREDE